MPKAKTTGTRKSSAGLPATMQAKSAPKVRGQGGQLTSFTPQVAAGIVEDVQFGMPVTLAAHRRRVGQSTVSQWLTKGENDPQSPYAEFAADVREAQAEFVHEAIDHIKQAGISDAKQWTALMTLLERIYPEYFKRPDGITINNIQNNVSVEAVLHEMHKEGALVYHGG